MANISDRIAQVIAHLKISTRAFEQQIGCSNGVIARCIGKGTDISSLWVSKIIEVYPVIDSDWLLIGRGSMLRINNQAQPISQTEVHPVTQPDSSFGEAATYIYKIYEKEKKENKIKVEELTAKMLQMAEELGSLKNQLFQYQPQPKQKGKPAVLSSTEIVPTVSTK